jgi:hypothetical protein
MLQLPQQRKTNLQQKHLLKVLKEDQLLKKNKLRLKKLRGKQKKLKGRD